MKMENNMDKATIKLGLVLGIVVTVGIVVTYIIFQNPGLVCQGFKTQPPEIIAQLQEKNAQLRGINAQLEKLNIQPQGLEEQLQDINYQLQQINAGPVCQWGWATLTITLMLAMVITLFGLLALPGARTDEGIFREERVRFAIAGTLLVVYFVLFCNAVLFGEGDKSINSKMMDTLTMLMTIVLPFYFGTSGLVEWAKRRGGNSGNTN